MWIVAGTVCLMIGVIIFFSIFRRDKDEFTSNAPEEFRPYTPGVSAVKQVAYSHTEAEAAGVPDTIPEAVPTTKTVKKQNRPLNKRKR